MLGVYNVMRYNVGVYLTCTSVEYYGECYCGASVQGVQVPDSQCSYPCTGNASEACGGNSIISVYQDPTFPSTNPSVITDYVASGCYAEGTSGRSLVYRQDNLDSTTLTVEGCLMSCKNNGYPLAGVEYGVSNNFLFLVYSHVSVR